MKSTTQLDTPVSPAPELCRLDLASLTTAYRKRQLSPVEVTQAALDRAEVIQEPLNAFTTLHHAQALETARMSEQRWQAGAPLSPVDGVPTTLKDIVHVAGWSVRYGSKTTDESSTQQDAPSVARLRDAGAVFFAQTTTPEFGWKAITDSSAFGVTRNPWNPTLTPGGSSGGAAVAAACGAGVLHLGTDGGGSIRIPASFTGIVGHKPSYGRVGAYPPSSFGTVAHIGPMTRTVADTAAMLAVMSGRDNRDWTQPPMLFSSVEPSRIDWRGKRVGYWKMPCVGSVEQPIALAVESVLQDLARAGAHIEEVCLPERDLLLEIFYRHWYVGAANRLSTVANHDHALLDPGFLKAAHIGQKYTAVERMNAEVQRIRYGAAMDTLLEAFDFLMSPTVPVSPFAAGHDVPPGSGLQSWVEWSSFSFPVNLSQQPACSVPCGSMPDGLPIGLQIISARGADSQVLSAALTYESMYPKRFLGSDRAWPGDPKGAH